MEQKHEYIIHTGLSQSFQGYRCESGIAIFARRGKSKITLTVPLNLSV